jgi:hypothetical protein
MKSAITSNLAALVLGYLRNDFGGAGVGIGTSVYYHASRHEKSSVLNSPATLNVLVKAITFHLSCLAPCT